MKNRVHVTETTFYINEESKTVVCCLKCDMQIRKHPAYYCFDSEAYRKRMPLVNTHGEFTVKAKAKCDNMDTFDVEKGKRLAESRAKAKMFSVAERVWQEIAQYLGNMVHECVKTAKACTLAKDIEGNHVKELEQE